MKTYAQFQGHHTIDWQYFLDHPPTANGGWKLAEKAALGFIQDPGGCLPVELQRGPGGELEDMKLRTLCRKFYFAIYLKNIGGAKALLEQINERANEILNQNQKNHGCNNKEVRTATA